MSSNNLVCGIGADTGPAIAIEQPVYLSGNVWYVDSVTGTDAASPVGKDRKRPLATLGQAITNSLDGDVIVMLKTHAETFTAVVTLSTKRLKFIGEGKNSGNPMVKLTLNHATAKLFDCTVRQEFYNVWFNEPQVPATGNIISLATENGSIISECYFECGANNDGTCVDVVADGTRIDNTTFISTAVLSTAVPREGLAVAGDYTRMDGVTFDGGSFGFANATSEPYAYEDGAAGNLLFTYLGISLLRGADMSITATATGFLATPTCTGGARVDWP